MPLRHYGLPDGTFTGSGSLCTPFCGSFVGADCTDAGARGQCRCPGVRSLARGEYNTGRILEFDGDIAGPHFGTLIHRRDIPRVVQESRFGVELWRYLSGTRTRLRTHRNGPQQGGHIHRWQGGACRTQPVIGAGPSLSVSRCTRRRANGRGSIFRNWHACDSAGADVVAQITQERHNIDAAFYIGKGKAEEIAALVEEKEAALVVFDDDLSAVQVRNLQKLFKVKILDRSGLILDIFASPGADTRSQDTGGARAIAVYASPAHAPMDASFEAVRGGIGTKGRAKRRSKPTGGHCARASARSRKNSRRLIVNARSSAKDASSSPASPLSAIPTPGSRPC